MGPIELRTQSVNQNPEEINIFTPREGVSEEEAVNCNSSCSSVMLGCSSFRVLVPSGWPGVQYRRSKNFEDRYQRYAQNGTIVKGQLEDNGKWLRLGSNVFLPMRLGSIQLVEPLPEEEQQAEE